MAYIFQMRRGVRHVDADGETLMKEDNTPVRDDWGAYTLKEGYIRPLEGELVIEFEVNPTTGKKLPRLKIGDGIHDFADLDYIGLDSFIIPATAPTYTSVTLQASQWLNATDEDNKVIEHRYYQILNLEGITVTAKSKIDIQLSLDDINSFAEKDITFTTGNRDGQVKIYAIGQKPELAHTFYITITEVS